MKRKLMAVCATVLTTVVCMSMFSGCSSSSSSSSSTSSSSSSEATTSSESEKMYTDKVVLGQSSWIGYAPLYLADKKGFFKDHGANVEVQQFESKTDSRSALATGKIQGISTTVDTFVMSQASGMNLSIVLALDTSAGGDGISAKNDIKDLKSLKGRSVALDTSGGASYFWFQYLLNQQNMTLDDVKVVNMSSGDAGAAFVSGQVDAAVTWEPWLSKAKATENGSVLIDSSETPGIIVDALAMNKEFTEKYPDTVKAIVSGWYDALAYMESDPDEANKILMQYTGDEEVEALEGAMSGVSFYDKEGNEKYFDGQIQDIAKKASDLWVENKLIDNAVDTDAMISKDFIGGLD